MTNILLLLIKISLFVTFVSPLSILSSKKVNTLISSSVLRLQQEESSKQHECEFCSTQFQSRNALFRHLRSSPECSQDGSENMQISSLLELSRYTLALEFSYWGGPSLEANDCGSRLEQAVIFAVNSMIQSELHYQGDDIAAKLISKTQVSVPRMRHPSLAQESGCYAAADVVVIAFMAPKGLIRTGKSRNECSDHIRSFLSKLMELGNSYLEANSEGADICLYGSKLLPADNKLHAERGCTQRVYHYLMPLQWLPDGTKIEEWWLEHKLTSNCHHTSSTPLSTDSLRMMKSILRSVESPVLEESITKEQSEQLSIKMASGRFGAFERRERRPFHNFADPRLQGSASPNNEPVWRALDRARITDMLKFTSLSGKEAVIAVLEFRGDDFLPEQIRRTIGTSLAVAHGWLPRNMFEEALKADTFFETPIAPAGMLYLAASRFHFEELKNRGKSIFATDKGGVSFQLPTRPLQEIQHKILHSHRFAQAFDSTWLEGVKEEVVPRINNLMRSKDFKSFVSIRNTSLPAENMQEYTRVIQMLREIIGDGKWPKTSTSRSSVISNLEKEDRNERNENGSFTIVNPQFREGLYQKGIGDNPLPLANNLFPDLVDAIFALELALSNQGSVEVVGENSLSPSRRPSSSHCAVNCNAQFTPHVDSGRGAGQSLSMIVGLGNYSGGSLAVEGVEYDIRYRPLEFDGWRLRHWTSPFSGERFSLVWFTPEVKNNQ